MKKALIALLLLAVLVCAGIVVSNNHVAEDLRKQVAGCMLPPNTELVESAAVSVKMDGKGMQYFGAALLHSQLDEGPLRVWYEAQLPKADNIQVARQTSPMLLDGQKRVFKDFEDDGHYWVVMLGR